MGDAPALGEVFRQQRALRLQCGEIDVAARGFCEQVELRGCALMEQFAADTTWLNQRGVLLNLETIQRGGLARWLEEQAGRWRCAGCGRPHTWWDEACPHCGQPVVSCRAEIQAGEDE